MTCLTAPLSAASVARLMPAPDHATRTATSAFLGQSGDDHRNTCMVPAGW